MRRWRKLWLIAGIGLCLILFLIARHYQLRLELARHLTELKSCGEPLNPAQLTPPSMPDDQNGVRFIAHALTNRLRPSLLQTNAPYAMRLVAPGQAMIVWQQPDIHDFHATNTWEDLSRELAAAKVDLDNSRSLTNEPVLYFNLSYNYTLRLSHLMPLRQLTDLFSASALLNSIASRRGSLR